MSDCERKNAIGCEGCEKDCEYNPSRKAKDEEIVTDTDNGAEMRGLNFMIKLSYACVDRSELSYEGKRNLLFGLYSFRCLFDGEELHRASKVLVKYGCSFLTRDEKALSYQHTYEVTDANGKKAIKYDAGSPLWQDKVRNKEITGENALLPQKPTLYEMAYSLLSLTTATAELKALWLVYFPYVFMLGAPIEYDLYDMLKERVMTAEVFAAANEARYADNICCTTAELSGEHPLIVDWYTPFVEWKCEKNEKGVSREAAKYQKALALGDYAYALHGTEKLLDSFPDDEEILLLNISARMSLVPSADEKTRQRLLEDNFTVITESFKLGPKKYIYFLYYLGMTRLGMNDTVHAEDNFRACLEIDPKFEPALLMLRGIENAKKDE